MNHAQSVWIRTVYVSLICASVMVAAPSSAQSNDAASSSDTPSAPANTNWLGETCSALPGLLRVGSPNVRRAGVYLAGCAGYGYTEDVLNRSDSHHRLFGNWAIAVRPIDWLAIGLRGDGRSDSHSSSGMSDDGLVGDPRLTIRAGGDLGGGLSLGGQIGLWIPGNDFPSLDFGALTTDFIGMASYSTETISLNANIGFRLDQSGKAAPVADRPGYSDADRLSLGLSDYNAFLLGVGGALKLDAIEILLEWSWDMLLGIPLDVMLSPMHIAGGARYSFSDTVSLQLLVDFSPSKRVPGGLRDLDANASIDLFPVDPLIAVSAGLNISIPFSSEPVGPRTGTVIGRVTAAEGGAGIGGVAVSAGAASFTTADDGSFTLSNVSEGTQTVRASLAGYTAAEATTEVVAGQTATVALSLAVARQGVRGTVRDQTGAAVVGATVAIGNLTGTTDAAGAYSIENVPPGPVSVTATQTGYENGTATQTLAAGQTVEANITMNKLPERGRLALLVRDFTGRPVAASVTVTPGNTAQTAGADGTLSIDLDPGEYDVSVSARGFRQETRHVTVEVNGTVQLNIELRRGR